ncbi:MAG TPA: hypothetical protein VGP08_25245 [Pyrinomonadaceae bacterium]|jgi:hypothetical protein|nr:hypothetical protein [Pyrinomonadaceae bacterium]
MINPCRKLTGWWEREGERAKAKGGLQLFWFALTNGLIWGLFMLVCLGLFDYLTGDTSVVKSIQSHFLVYFVIGMLVGFTTWKQLLKSGKGRP